MVKLTLTPDEAVVLFEFLSRFGTRDVLSIEHDGERQALCNSLCSLEKNLTEPFQADYNERLAAARRRLS